MKNPKSNYIGEARRIRRNRLIINGIIAGSVLLIVGFIVFFSYIIGLKKKIDKKYPDTTTAGPPTLQSTSDTSEIEPDDSSTTAVTDTTPDPALTETTPDPNTSSEGDPTADPTGDTTEPAETTINLLPDDWGEREPVLFPEKYPLQTVTHAERDQSYSNLKHAVKKYIEEHSEARVGFYYINLSTSEAFGYNEVAPFVVGSSIDLPIVMMLYDDVKAGKISLQTAMAYSSAYAPGAAASGIAAGPEGKQYFLDQLAYIALRDGDAAAMNMIFERMGGLEEILPRLSEMTLAVDFATIQNYVDFRGTQQSGIYRSSAYDLASYAEMLYWRYMSYPNEYQDLIDALAEKGAGTGVGRYFPTGTLVLHRPGSNTDYCSESDVAIILSSEPVIICVTVEAATPEAAREIQSALGALVYNFISYCHT
ncbi:MAG: serine hydrolase [Clostridiales bacterium]|nr:serine hydrolase [Clostridiales bacterium]